MFFVSVFVFNIYFPALKFASILRNSRVGSQFLKMVYLTVSYPR